MHVNLDSLFEIDTTRGYGEGAFGAGEYGTTGSGRSAWSALLVPFGENPNHSLLSSRVTGYQFELLENLPNRYEALVGELAHVVGGEISWTYNASVKGGGSIDLEVIDPQVLPDWSKTRIRVTAVINDTETVPVGVFLASAPGESHSAAGVGVTLEVHDKCIILDEDVYADPATGQGLIFSIPAGTDVMATIRLLIDEAGERATLIPTDLELLTTSPMTWDLDTTRLQIINDLLSAVNYFSLWCDGRGQFRVTPYVPPANRPAQFEALKPFEDGRLMAPDWDSDHDIHSMPNRFVASTSGDGENEALISTAMLEPSHPYSFANRRRWITRTETGVNAVNQESLDRYAAWRLAIAVSNAQRFAIRHPLLPGLRVNDNVAFAAGRRPRTLCTVYKTTIPLDPTGLCATELAEVTTVIEDPVMDQPTEPEPEPDGEDYE